MKQTYEGPDASRMTSYQPLIKNLHSLSLKNRNLQKDFDRTILGPGTDKYKLYELMPGTTKSPRIPMHLQINSYVSSPRQLSSEESPENDSNSRIISFIDANKHERRQDSTVREFIVKNVLNGLNTSKIRGLTSAKDFQKNKRKGATETMPTEESSEFALPDKNRLEVFDD